MKRGLGIATGIVIGLTIAGVAGLFVLPSSAFNAHAAPQAGADSNNGTMILGTGGGSANQNDLCWVMSKVKPAKGPERTVLALYRAKRGGDYFDLEDVRMLDADLRVIELKGTAHDAKTNFKAIVEQLPKEERESLFPK